MPKFTTDEIKADIAALETGGFRCAIYYLKAEVKRRDGSALNAGRTITNDTPRHAQMRAAAAKYRKSKK